MIDKMSKLGLAPIILIAAAALAIAVPAPSTVAVLIVATMNHQAMKAWAYLEAKSLPSESDRREPGADIQNIKERVAKLELKAGFEGR